MKPLKIDFQPFSRTLSLPFQEQKNDIHKTSQQVFSIHPHQQEMLLYFTRSPNLVIFVKVIFVIFDFENDKNDFDKNDTLSLLRWLIFNGFVTA